MIARDEHLFTVDKFNNPIAPKSRKFVHANKIWHRTSHIWIINEKKQVLCQKRSLLKDMNPGKWESFFGGHVLSGQSYKESAHDELNEELGINAKKKEIRFCFINKSENDNEFQAVHYVKWLGKLSSLKLEEEEVAEIKWYGIAKLHKIYEKKDKEWTSFGYEVSLLQRFAILA